MYKILLILVVKIIVKNVEWVIKIIIQEKSFWLVKAKDFITYAVYRNIIWAVRPMKESKFFVLIVKFTCILFKAELFTFLKIFFTIWQWIFFKGSLVPMKAGSISMRAD